jgi:hypothetical protein
MARRTGAVVATAAIAAPAAASAAAVTPLRLLGPTIGPKQPQELSDQTLWAGHGIRWWAAYWAAMDYSSPADTSYCTGPYQAEHRHHHTQWACYGHFAYARSEHWQVNLDQYGSQTYFDAW